MPELIVENANGVRTLKLNRPERLNAYTTEMSNQLIEELNRASMDDEVRVIVITGEGRGFCSGIDLTNVGKGRPDDRSRYDRLDELSWVGRMALAICKNDKPVIAAVNGVAAGAGAAMAMACDFRLMKSTARFTTGYIRNGLCPDAGMSYFLPRLIGLARATELVLTGRDVSAEEAVQIGLANQVIPEEQWEEGVREFAERLAAGPPIALTYSKRLLIDGLETNLETHLKRELVLIHKCFQSEDTKEAVQAFFEKRKPEFQGR